MTLRAGDVVVAPACGSARRRSARSPPQESPASAAHALRGSRCSSRAASCGHRASRSAPGELYDANGPLLETGLRAAGADRRAAASGGGRARGDARRRSSAASPPTCSSRAAASRWAPTTSFARPRPSSGSRRCSGGSPSGPESRSRSGCAAGRSCSACREPRLGARRARALRPPRAARAPGRMRDRARVPARRPRRAVRATASATRCVRARASVEAGAVVLDPLVGQQSHMIARAALANALRARAARRRERSTRAARSSYLALS